MSVFLKEFSDFFLEIIAKLQKQIVFIIHINCLEELDLSVMESCRKLMKLKIPVLSQSVLMKGVNDNFDSLYNLFDYLIQYGVIPYYLHKLDHVKGSTHFKVNEKKGINLIKQLRETLPGYAVPRFVKEIYGEKCKTLIK